MLPNDTLLDIFDFHRIRECETNHLGWGWYRLVHVCRLWRQIIFASPLRLRLHLRCTNNTPVRKHLGVWPPLPLTVGYDLITGQAPNPEDNLLAALENPDRVVVFGLRFMDSHLAKLATVLQKPFPVLTNLRLALEMGRSRFLPDQNCQHFFYQLVALSLYIFKKYRLLVTFHLKRWPHACLH